MAVLFGMAILVVYELKTTILLNLSDIKAKNGMKHAYILFLLCLITRFDVMAQTTSKFQIWNDFNPTFRINERWQVGGDLGYRIQPSANFHTAYIRPEVSYILNKILYFTIGVANFNRWEPDNFNSIELRTFQFVNALWPRVNGFQFKHRLGLEQRWFYLPEPEQVKYISRARYYLEVKSPKFKLFGLGSPFFVEGNVEFLRDVNNDELGRLFDHDRFTFGIGNHITDRFRADLRYRFINLVEITSNTFVREFNVLRVRLYYQLSPTTSKSMGK